MSLDSTHTNINPGAILPSLGNALSSEVSQATVESAMNAVAFSHPVVCIASFLDPDSLSKLSCTSRVWRVFTRNEDLWHMLLQRDFGEKAALEVGGNFRDAYLENFNRLREFIKELPGGQQLLEDSRIDALRETVLHKAGGLLSVRCLDVYINELSQSDLAHVFCKSMEFGFIPIVRAIVESGRFNEIDANGERGLGVALARAADSGRIEATQLIMENSRFAEINANGQDGLGAALTRAAGSGCVEVVQLIMEHPRFDEIDANGDYGLGYALIVAADSGRIEAMKLIMEHPRFDEIDANALIVAAFSGRIESMMKLIMEHPRFVEIDANREYGLDSAITQSVISIGLHMLKSPVGLYILKKMAGYIAGRLKII